LSSLSTIQPLLEGRLKNRWTDLPYISPSITSQKNWTGVIWMAAVYSEVEDLFPLAVLFKDGCNPP